MKKRSLLFAMLAILTIINVSIANIETLVKAINEQNIGKIKELLLEKKLDVNKVYRHGMTPLAYAIIKNNLEIVKELLEKKETKINIKGTLSPITFAVQKHINPKIFEAIIKKVDINSKDRYGKTPLYSLISLLITKPELSNRIKTGISTLIKRDADVDTEKLTSFLITSLINKDPKIYPIISATKSLETLYPKWKNLNELLFAKLAETSKIKDQIIINFIKNSQINVNAKINGTPLLSFACRYYRPQLVTCMINKKADVNATDYNKNTPLHILAETSNWHKSQQDSTKRIDIAKILIQNGAKTLTKNINNNIPLDIVSRSDKNFIRYLQEKKLKEAKKIYETKKKGKPYKKKSLEIAFFSEKCPVCFDNFNEKKQRLILLPCGHNICTTCWPQLRTDKCPICRKKIKEPRLESELMIEKIIHLEDAEKKE